MPNNVSPQSSAAGTAPATTAPTVVLTSVPLPSTLLQQIRKHLDHVQFSSSLEAPEAAIPVTKPVETSLRFGKKKKAVTADKEEAEGESDAETLEDSTPQQDNAHDKALLYTGKVRMMSEPYIIQTDSRSGSLEFQEITLNTFRYDTLQEATYKGSSFVKKPWLFFRSIRPSTYVPLTTIACLSALLMMPIRDFYRGVVATVLGLITIDTVLRHISYFIAKASPERSLFQIPDYSGMPTLEVPIVEESSTFKSYAGWMNEVDSYDPNDFHISMSKSVFVALEGTILRLSTTAARIPKKVLWDEPPIDYSTITFTEHRKFNLKGCRVELLPLGLARKKYFSRKYPIQLTVRSDKDEIQDEEITSLHGGASSQISSNYKDAFELNSVDSEAMHSAAADNASLIANNAFKVSEARTEDTDVNFAETVLREDNQLHQDSFNVNEDDEDLTAPPGDEIRILLFSRGNREKEDWYRRFVAASSGKVQELTLRLPNVKIIDASDLQSKAEKAAQQLTNIEPNDDDSKSTIPDEASTSASVNSDPRSKEKDVKFALSTKSSEKELKESSSKLQQASDSTLNIELDDDSEFVDSKDDETYEGLIMDWSVIRNPVDYVRFMVNYQKACTQSTIPVVKNIPSPSKKENKNRKQRRARRQENELWKGIDQTLFLGPSGSVVWANVLMGRVIYSCLHDSSVKIKLKNMLQKKLSSLKLPSFMEDVVITQIHLGDAAPLIHRVSQPLLDERGTWLEVDMTYEGYCFITMITKLNLLRIKRRSLIETELVEPSKSSASAASSAAMSQPSNDVIENDESDTFNAVNYISEQHLKEPIANSENMEDTLTSNATFGSDAENSDGSGSESDSQNTQSGPSTDSAAPAKSKPRRLFRLRDRFKASNLFHYATEIPYVQRAMENMNANIALRVDLQGIVARGVINLPPPPSDRIWLAFRGPPRLWISARPTVGDKSVDWSIVTNVIESKLCEQVNRYLVYPNMVDIHIPFLGQPTYNE